MGESAGWNSTVNRTTQRRTEVFRQFARQLTIEIRESEPFERYPSIKCNVSRRRGEKIYHLPFDQQYDNTIIEEERLEMYAETVAEAEAAGFRRAYKWKGERVE